MWIKIHQKYHCGLPNELSWVLFFCFCFVPCSKEAVKHVLGVFSGDLWLDCREFYLDSFCLAKISVTVFSQAKKALANQLVYDLSRQASQDLKTFWTKTEVERYIAAQNTDSISQQCAQLSFKEQSGKMKIARSFFKNIAFLLRLALRKTFF